MREVKFRGRSTSTYRNVFGSLCVFNTFNGGKVYSIKEDDDNFEPVYEETIVQYTGLKDKNGVEIYEGDIVASCGRKDVPCVVEYNQDRCEFVMRYDGNGILHLVEEFKNSYEVIGNIYDNPELLR